MADEPVIPVSGALLGALWHQLLSSWDDADAHAAFLRAAQASGRLPEAAMRYRGMMGDRERRQLAERQLAAITILALSSLESVRTKAPVGRNVRRYSALAAVILFSIALLLCARALHR